MSLARIGFDWREKGRSEVNTAKLDCSDRIFVGSVEPFDRTMTRCCEGDSWHFIPNRDCEEEPRQAEWRGNWTFRLACDVKWSGRASSTPAAWSGNDDSHLDGDL